MDLPDLPEHSGQWKGDLVDSKCIAAKDQVPVVPEMLISGGFSSTYINDWKGFFTSASEALSLLKRLYRHGEEGTDRQLLRSVGLLKHFS